MIDWHLVSRAFPCRLGPDDCGTRCIGPHGCCHGPQFHPLLPGEGPFLADHGFPVGWDPERGVDIMQCDGRQSCPGPLRPVVCKTFPLSPGPLGLEVLRECPESGWLRWQFVVEVERMWRYLIAAEPRCVEWIGRVRDAVWSKEGRVLLWTLDHPFDAGYSSRFEQDFRLEFREALWNMGWIQPGERVLDAGGGRGQGAMFLRERGVDVTVVDVNADLIEAGGGGIADVRDLPFPDRSFDAAFCCDVLEHLDNPLDGARELFRVSRGRVVVYVTTLEQIENMLADPTHRTFWPFVLWLERLATVGQILAVDWSHTGVLLGHLDIGES